MRLRRGMLVDPRQIPAVLMAPAMDAGQPVMQVHGARRNGRSTASRLTAEHHAAAGSHIHVVGHDGAWGVTLQPVGFLYVRLRRLGSPGA